MRRSLPTPRNKLALLDAARVCHHLPRLAGIAQADKMVLGALFGHLGQDQLEAGKTVVWPSVRCLALDTGYTERQVRRSLVDLEAAGLIRRFIARGWRTPHTDLAGFIAIAADALEAHADAKSGLRLVGGSDAGDETKQERPAASDPDITSAEADIESAYTETDIEPELSVHHADALSRETGVGDGLSAAAGSHNNPTPKPQNPDTAQPAPLLPREASFGAGAEPEGSIPAETPRDALLALQDASPTLRRIFLPGEIASAPLEALSETIRRDYLATVGDRMRNPKLIWTWAVRRHGETNAMLGWLIACDCPASATGAPRNPQGWFTRFATAETPWNLAPNLKQLRQRQAARTRRAGAAPGTARPVGTANGGGSAQTGHPKATAEAAPAADAIGNLIPGSGFSEARAQAHGQTHPANSATGNRNDKARYGDAGSGPASLAADSPREDCETAAASTSDQAGLHTLQLGLDLPDTANGCNLDARHGLPEGGQKKPAPGSQLKGGLRSCDGQFADDLDPKDSPAPTGFEAPGRGETGRPADPAPQNLGQKPIQSTPADAETPVPIDAFRAAWIAILARAIGPNRADAAWAAWLTQARLIDPGDGSLRLIVKTGFARDHLRSQHGDTCDQAARRCGFSHCEVDCR